MMKASTVENFTADLPANLGEADEILTRYGRWAANLGGSAHTCGSAEGNYRPSGAGALEARSVPMGGLLMHQRVAAQRALARVPAPEREVLAVLYVPRQRGIGHQLRLLRIPPLMCRDCHLAGLRIWWNLYLAALTAP